MYKDTFSNQELWFLLSQFSPSTVVGFPDPMLGLLANEVDEIIESVMASLEQKKKITVRSNGNVQIENSLRKAVHTIAAPCHSILFNYKQKGDARENVASVHISQNYAVLLEEKEDRQFSLQEIDKNDDIFSFFLKPLTPFIFWAPDSGAVYINQSSIKAMYENIDKGLIEEAHFQISTARGDQASKLDLISALQHPEVNLSLVVFCERNNPKKSFVDGISIIAGDRYLWILELIDEKDHMIRATKVTVRELKNTVKLRLPTLG
jgi:hypothetical protein